MLFYRFFIVDDDEKPLRKARDESSSRGSPHNWDECLWNWKLSLTWRFGRVDSVERGGWKLFRWMLHEIFPLLWASTVPEWASSASCADDFDLKPTRWMYASGVSYLNGRVEVISFVISLSYEKRTFNAANWSRVAIRTSTMDENLDALEWNSTRFECLNWTCDSFSRFSDESSSASSERSKSLIHFEFFMLP